MPHRENPWNSNPDSSTKSNEEIAARFTEAFEVEFNTSSEHKEHKESNYCPHCEAVEALQELCSKLKAVNPKISNVDFYGILGLGIDSLIQEEPDSTKFKCVKALQSGMEAGAEARIMGPLGDLFELLTNPSSFNKP